MHPPLDCLPPIISLAAMLFCGRTKTCGALCNDACSLFARCYSQFSATCRGATVVPLSPSRLQRRQIGVVCTDQEPISGHSQHGHKVRAVETRPCMRLTLP